MNAEERGGAGVIAAEKKARQSRLALAFRRHYPWRFAALVFCTTYTSYGLAFDLMDLFWAGSSPAGLKYSMPLTFAVLLSPWGQRHVYRGKPRPAVARSTQKAVRLDRLMLVFRRRSPWGFAL